MPTYVLRCPKCGDITEEYMSISDFETYTDFHCDVPRETVIQPVKGHVQMEMRYKSVVTGNEITTWQGRREEFARENLMDVSDMPTDWKDDIGQLPKWQRPITDKNGKEINDPMVGWTTPTELNATE